MRKICWCSQSTPYWSCHYITRTIKPLSFLWNWIIWYTFINDKYSSYLNKILFPIYVCIYLCVYRHMSARHVYGKEDSCGSWFFYMWVWEMESRSSEFVAYTVIHWAILPVFQFFVVWNHRLSWLAFFVISSSFVLIVCLLQVLFRDCSLSAHKSKS